MSMSPTHHGDLHQTREPDGDEREGASPLLWGLLILALVAAPAWWWIRNSSEPHTVVAPAVGNSAPAADSQVIPPPAQQKQPTMVHKESPRSAAARGDHDARPLGSNAAPSYPPRALRAGIESGVVAQLEVDPRGHVGEVSIVERSGPRDRDIDRAVINTLRGWRFEPAVRDGQAVASSVRVPVDFKTQQ